MEASYKPYPVCALQQVPIELISDLMRRESIKPNDIKEVVERVSEWEAAFPGGNFSPALSRMQIRRCRVSSFVLPQHS